MKKVMVQGCTLRLQGIVFTHTCLKGHVENISKGTTI